MVAELLGVCMMEIGQELSQSSRILIIDMNWNQTVSVSYTLQRIERHFSALFIPMVASFLAVSYIVRTTRTFYQKWGARFVEIQWRVLQN